MKRTLTLLLLAALWIGGCKDAAAPTEPAGLRDPDYAAAPTDPAGGMVVPDDGKLYAITGPMVAPTGLSNALGTPDAGVTTGQFVMRCISMTDSRKCTLYFLGATSMTTVAIATCISGVFTAGCAGAIISAYYSWDLFYSEPPCWGCRMPFDVMTTGLWRRTDSFFGRK